MYYNIILKQVSVLQISQLLHKIIIFQFAFIKIIIFYGWKKGFYL